MLLVFRQRKMVPVSSQPLSFIPFRPIRHTLFAVLQPASQLLAPLNPNPLKIFRGTIRILLVFRQRKMVPVSSQPLSFIPFRPIRHTLFAVLQPASQLLAPLLDPKPDPPKNIPRHYSFECSWFFGNGKWYQFHPNPSPSSPSDP